MAEIPFYLQGTQTAGLFQQPAGQQAQTPYTPGYGMPLYNDQSYVPSIPNASVPSYDPQLARNQAVSDLQAQLMSQGLSPENAFQQANSQIGDLSSFTTVGQDEAWLSPDELRAKTNALQTRGGPSLTGGTSTGGATASSSTSSSGGLLGSGSGSSQLSGPNVGGFPNIQTGGTPNFMSPGQTPSGQSPGSLPGQGGSNTQPGGAVPMMQANPQNSLQSYYNTPGYQLTEGSGAVNQFQTGPGYQFAVDQAMRQVQGNAASRGLLDSGAALRSMQDRAYGLANQEFGNWQNRQQQMYNNYQNRLAGLAGGPTGAEQAFQLGQGQAGIASQTGSDIASLLANQGSSLFGGITGTGAAQAQNVSNAGNMQAQILSGNMATQLAAAAAGGLFK